ncbi:hypothetical protein TorRG33x02_353410, partial [Trema orientale]
DTSLSPDGKLLTVVQEDNQDDMLVDPQLERTVLFQIWDICNLSQSVAVLRGNTVAIRSICFTYDGCGGGSRDSTLCMSMM